MSKETKRIVRITKIFPFEMAHLISTHKGRCKNIHGHSYQLHITLKGEIKNDLTQGNYGMVMDFSELKDIVNRAVIDEFDHACVISKQSGIKANPSFGNRVIYSDFEPTCEELLFNFAERIQKLLPDKNLLYSLKLFETQTSYAEWICHDSN